jgi:hypothetical protein
MAAQYEYQFVRLEQVKNLLTGMPVPSEKARQEYQELVHEQARQGWRLVQIFAPGTSVHGLASYFELIFERPVEAGVK